MSTKWKNKTPWAGGYVRIDSRGRPTFMIQKRVKPFGPNAARWPPDNKFHLSTGCHTIGAANVAFEDFEKDPIAFRDRAKLAIAQKRNVRLEADLIIEYRTWQTAAKPLGLGNSEEHAKDMASKLRDWLQDLKGKDLRQHPEDADPNHVSLARDIWPALERRAQSPEGGAIPRRIDALKHFYTFLRIRKKLVKAHEDPTQDLVADKGEAAKDKEQKAQAIEDVKRTLDQLAEWAATKHPFVKMINHKKGRRAGKTQKRTFSHDWHVVRAWLVVLANTAWHLAEWYRFRKSPDITELPENHIDGVAVIKVWHKNKKWHYSTIETAELLESVHMVLDNPVPQALAARMKAAAEAVGVKNWENIRPGTMRHSSGTWDATSGATDQEAADRLGHTVETFRKHYKDQLAAIRPPRTSSAPILH